MKVELTETGAHIQSEYGAHEEMWISASEALRLWFWLNQYRPELQLKLLAAKQAEQREEQEIA